jgi:hypothetical protein
LAERRRRRCDANIFLSKIAIGIPDNLILNLVLTHTTVAVVARHRLVVRVARADRRRRHRIVGDGGTNNNNDDSN